MTHSATAYDTIIDPVELHAHIADPDWVIVDCRFNLLDPQAGRRDYKAGHIPGALYADLDRDLSEKTNPQHGRSGGRHPLPDPQRLVATLTGWSIGVATQVVAYDAAGGAIAARLWWLLRWLGHRRCAVLNGGLPAWVANGYELSTEQPDPLPAARPLPAVTSGAASVSVDSLEQAAPLIDARAAARYRGEQEPIDPVAGHVPGAINLPQADNLDPSSGRFLAPELLRKRFVTALAGRDPAQAVHMCGSGVSACHNLLAMEIAGLPGGALYPGSWSEWVSDPSRPVASGDKP